MRRLTTATPVRDVFIISKLFYFCYFAASAALIPFLPLYYAAHGIPGGQIGVLVGLPPLIALVSGPLWGGLADVTQRHKQALLFSIIGAMAAVLLLSTARAYWWLLVIVILYAFLQAPIMPLVDSTVLAMLGQQRDQYGKQRLWGAVGWGVAAPLIGWLVERTGPIGSFYGYLALMAVGLFAASRFSMQHTPVQSPFWSGLRGLLVNRTWIVFLLTILLAGMGLAIVTNFLFLYLADLGANTGLMGWSLAVATVSELPVMFYANRLLRRWGARTMLMVSLAAYVVRVLLYSILTTPLQVLPVQLLHGLTFSLMWVAGVAYVDEHAPPGLGATTQALFSSTIMGLGAAFGSLIGGILYESVGPMLMFRVTGFGILFGLIIFQFAAEKEEG